jgi:16S rRNA (cytosine1402-N4)-methyltransferase
MPYSHQPVMLEEVVHYLKLKRGDKVIDCTSGGGGHALAILKRIIPTGKLLGIDLDPLAIQAAGEATKDYKRKIILVKDNFKNLKSIANVNRFYKVNSILLDLGLSSGQIQDQRRGFSFLAEGSLDMRFGPLSDLTAEKILNTYNQKELIEIFKSFGEEKLAKPISQKIIEMRKKAPLTSPKQLVEITSEIYRKYYRGKSKINPATKVFQALRIAVNQEFENLKEILPQAVKLLIKGGRLVIISYHSLEDKIVKEFFKQESRDCICPPQRPTCQCQHKKTLKIITKKPATPKEEETTENPRARSAKMRVAEKI